MMFNRNTAWKRSNDSYRIHAIGLSCLILAGQIATAQSISLLSETVAEQTEFQPTRIGTSIAGQRIASVTCDPFSPPNAGQCVCLVIVSSTETHLAIQNLLDQINFAKRPTASGVLPIRSKLNFEKAAPLAPSLIKRWYSDRFDSNPF